MYLYLCVSASIHVCVHVYVSVYMYVCGVTNIKLVSLACMPDEPKSAKCKNGICICVSVHVHVLVCIYFHVYVMCQI